MKALACLFILCVPLVNSAQEAITLNQVQGAWACVYSEYGDYVAEELPPYWLPAPNRILIEKDSLFEFDYPCEMVSRKRVAITNGIIHSADDSTIGQPRNITPLIPFGYWPASVSVVNDTLFLKTSAGRHTWTEKRYVRTTLDSVTVAWLRKYSVHVHCLYGRWNLKTTYDSGYDGNGIVPYDFPFRPQHVLVFTSNSRIDFSSRILWLQVNGAAKPFYILSLCCDGQRLEVQTMDWYKGEPYQLNYLKE